MAYVFQRLFFISCIVVFGLMTPAVFPAQTAVWQDIIVQGQVIRNQVEQSLAQGKEIFANGVPLVAETADDLRLVAEFLATAYEKIEQIELNQESIVINYQSEAKLFGLIPLSYTVEVSVALSPDQTVKVSGPWWLFLAQDDLGQIRQNVQSQLDTFVPPPVDDNDLSLRHKLLLTISKALGPADQEQN